MSTLLLLACGVLPAVAQQVKKPGNKTAYTVSGKIAALKEGKIYLSNTDDGGKIDSTMVKDGRFTFKGEIVEPMFYILKLPGQNGGKGFFLEPGNITITGHKDSLYKAEVVGSGAQNEYEEWSRVWRAIAMQAGPMYHRLDSVTAHGKVKEAKEERKIFDDGMEALSIQTYAAATAFIKKYPQSPVGPFIISDRYISYPDAERLAGSFALLGEGARQSYYGKKISEYRDIMAKTAIGASPDFTLADTAGNMLKLSSLKGKYVLVDFWASWCGPCRKENPNVVAAYQKYHSQGFDIVGISLDTKKDAWMKAIAKDGLDWNHVSDLRGWESLIVKELGIHAIPTSFLLDKDGKVIANNLRGEALLEKLGTLMKDNAKARPREDTTIKYFSWLAGSPDEANKALLRSKLYELLKSDKEEDWLTANRFFYQLKMNTTCDSLMKADKIKFPEGQLVRGDEVKKVYDAKGGTAKEDAYKVWIKQFPPEKFGTDRIVYDYARQAVGCEYAREENMPGAMAYANMVETGAWKGEGKAGVAYPLIEKGHYKEAGELLKAAIADARSYIATHDDNGAKFAAVGIPSYYVKYAEILYREKQYPEALKYITAAYDSAKEVRANVNAIYSDILMAMGKDREAFDKIDEAVKAGQATPAMKESLKKLYVKVKGSEAGYDAYLANVNKQLTDKFMKELPKQMINLQAPSFTLQDLEGNTVNLADLKGKTVVVDFWATWCGPCKASFPAMQMAVNKYKDSADVKFLFIHTWEHEDSATQLARKYITDMKYSFQVLMDLKNKTTGTNKVVEDFKITGIPTKFVIDKNGHIRFRLTGFSGGNDAAVEELSAMIQLAEKS